MENTNKTTTRKGTPRQNKPANRASNNTANASNQQKIVVKDIDASQYVIVRNGFQGRLVYRSPRTGERFIWDGFGAEQEMELRELRNAKNSSKKFFINNWFMFDDDWVIDYLGVRQYYKNAIRIDNFDEIFKKSPAELNAMLKGVSEGQKRSIAYRAKELIADKKIDSLSVISTLEKALNIELIER